MWPDVLDKLSGLRRTSWTLVSQNAQVASLEGSRLVLAFSSAGLRDTFARGAHPELVRQAVIDAIGLDCTVEAIVDPSASGLTAQGAGAPARPQARPPARPSEQPTVSSAGERPAADAAGSDDGPRQASAPGRPRARPAARAAGAAEVTPVVPPPVPPQEDEPSADDADLDEAGVTGAALVERMLGAKVIGEFDNT
jgi:DNA polymerase-3 subunit gamma/tau